MFYLKSTNGFYPSQNYFGVDFSQAVEISPEEHAMLMEGQSAGGIIKADEAGVPYIAPPEPPTLPELKAIKKAQINGAFEHSMKMITSGYPQDEIASWGKQEQEARAFVADAESATPLIGALSTVRGVEKADLVGRIIYKADAFAQIGGQLIGKRQALEDAIDAAEIAEALEPISW